MNVYDDAENLEFNSNYYKVEKYGQGFSVHVMTKNAENLGSKPVLETSWGNAEMIFDGAYYVSRVTPNNSYRIKYLDTGLYENNGEEKSFDYDKFNEILKKDNPYKNIVLSEGSACGKLIHAKDINPNLLNLNVPLIIICENEKECYKTFHYADGMIVKSGPAELLSHFSTICRDYFSFGCLITDTALLQNLESYVGKFISITNENNIICYQEILPISKTPKEINSIKIPELKKIDKILTLEECEKDIVGNKAYNLKRMKQLVKEKKLQDVIIPNAFVLPYAYLDHIEDLILKDRKNRWSDNHILQEIMNFSKDIITEKYIVIRSAFNGEDLENYSAAGLYDSKIDSIKGFRIGIIHDVMNSKFNPCAIKSRKRHGIPDESIKPSVIIQDYIIADFSFTLYTESPFNSDNKILIELFVNENRQMHPDPYQIIYDKETKKMTIEKEHSLMTEYIFDEKYNLIYKKITGKHQINKIWSVIKTLVKNALVLEKEFGKPQDIEGGIKDGKLYIWQTRNIVKKIRS